MAHKALTCLGLMRRTRGINEAWSEGTNSLKSKCVEVNPRKIGQKGSDNPQITITDPAHWHWQSGVIYQKPSYLLRRLNKGAKPHPGISSKEGHSSKNLVATWKQQPVLSLGA